MGWSGQQGAALESVEKWLKGGNRSPQVFKLFGFAGTGKTTLAREVEGMVNRVMYATFTGKAALVMRGKGCEGASTLHSLIYKVEEDYRGKLRFRLNRDSLIRAAKVLVIDEASMVGEELGRDAMSFGVKILVLGDPFQLPPVKDAGFFTNGEPEVMLTEIHRQATDNPIIRMSMDIREGRGLPLGTYGESKVISRTQLGQKAAMESDQLLCGLNKSRRAYNAKIRSLKGMDGNTPITGDRVVCLKNDREKGLLNGSLWTVEKASSDGVIVSMSVEGDDDSFADVTVPTNFFNGTDDSLDRFMRRDHDEFDFGYCLTVHKSQGSQWNNVTLFDESKSFRDDANRWLYTGVTRAAQRITVVK